MRRFVTKKRFVPHNPLQLADKPYYQLRAFCVGDKGTAPDKFWFWLTMKPVFVSILENKETDIEYYLRGARPWWMYALTLTHLALRI